MFTVRPLRALNTIRKQVSSAKAPIKSLIETRIAGQLQEKASAYNFNCQDAKLIIKDHPVKRMIQRVIGKSEDNMPVEIKGVVSSSLFGKENISIEKFEDKITYKELKEVALGNSSRPSEDSFITKVCQKLANMKKIGLA